MDPITIATLVNTLTPTIVAIIGLFRQAGVPDADIVNILDGALATHLSEIEILRARLKEGA
jgi:hypothetical protein